jgi:hypothetical protein
MSIENAPLPPELPESNPTNPAESAPEENVHEYQEHAFEHAGILGKTLDFEDPDNQKSTPVTIARLNEILGSGSVADWVASVNVEIANEDGTAKKSRDMVLKHYSDSAHRSGEIMDEYDRKMGRKESGSPLRRSYNTYRMLRDAGIATWDTYRINEENRVALMTLGVDEKETLRTTNDRDHVVRPRDRQLIENPLTEIESEAEFVQGLRSILDKADASGLNLDPDSWAVAFAPSDKSGAYRLRAMIADFDSIEPIEASRLVKALFPGTVRRAVRERNLENLNTALWGIQIGTREEKNEFANGIVQKVDSNFVPFRSA